MTEMLENAYSMVGLGNVSPMIRGAVTGGVIAAGMMTLKPAMMFDEAGNALPWSLTAPEGVRSTALPWWMPAAFGFIVGGVLI